MSKILYEVYKNDIKDSESAMYGKYYARLMGINVQKKSCFIILAVQKMCNFAA